MRLTIAVWDDDAEASVYRSRHWGRVGTLRVVPGRIAAEPGLCRSELAAKFISLLIQMPDH